MEERNINTINLDDLSTFEVLKKINEEDKKVAEAVDKELPSIEKAVDIIVEGFKNGGRLFYIGSGSSGKIGVMDASECPPTFGVDDSMVQGIISGGNNALSGWLEETEDDGDLAVKDLKEKGINKKDVVVGITASGNTPYVNSAIEYSNKIGCKTIGIVCSQGTLSEKSDVTICVNVGPEVIMGSTRMKAGTAEKMVLNMLSTTSMIKIGNTYSNLMVNVRPINEKLRERVKKIVKLATNADDLVIDKIVKECNYNAKVAIVTIMMGEDVPKACELLKKFQGNISKAIKSLK
ncbi:MULTISPECIES: N-acetylmuramic acid 6-phosphate etherase [Clostridium]|uniref:N-acetylmuramic acid 6-phosphate etherase n=1 Tax=Clostridium TaxID=1485 RepID=UPI00069EBBC9|nr:N-acetylmuramic acid-6-phosphate etherase [Clostridium sp. DMHC 10]MCD2346938.1 N-acetylmuramic acid 6-phosphate etherase [Clostridium guangxiense]